MLTATDITQFLIALEKANSEEEIVIIILEIAKRTEENLKSETVKVTMYVPKEITRDKEDKGLNIASFDYYSGIEYAKIKGLVFSTDFGTVRNKTGYIVCCGDVMVRVEPNDYPDIVRRDI